LKPRFRKEWQFGSDALASPVDEVETSFPIYEVETSFPGGLIEGLFLGENITKKKQKKSPALPRRVEAYVSKKCFFEGWLFN